MTKTFGNTLYKRIYQIILIVKALRNGHILSPANRGMINQRTARQSVGGIIAHKHIRKIFFRAVKPIVHTAKHSISVGITCHTRRYHSPRPKHTIVILSFAEQLFLFGIIR